MGAVMNRTGIITIGFLLCASLGRVANADSPLPSPKILETFSPNHSIVAVSDPELMTTTVLRIESNGSRTRLWATYGWHRYFYAANDGEHAAIVYSGGNLLEVKHRANEPMIWFLDKGNLIKVVTLDQIIHNQSSLRRTASHFLWGMPAGFDVKGRFGVSTAEGFRVFDQKTGELLKTQDFSYDDVK
jgi:hypothetical protein